MISTMADKVRLLFVVSEFYQAGTERFTYEVHRAIDRDHFHISFLSLLPLGQSERWKDHYYEKHIELGAEIHFLSDVDVIRHPTLCERAARIMMGRPLPNEHAHLQDFLDRFDCISVMGEYNYTGIARYMTREQKGRTLVHIQNSKHQKPDIYHHYRKDEHVHFVSGFDERSVAWELSEFEAYDHTYFGLNQRIETEHVKQDYRSNPDEPRIGIFTRITAHKPLDPFIYAFQLVCDRFPRAQFHLFGSGDPVQEGVTGYVNRLGLEGNVHFRGHQSEIRQTAIEEQLDVVWLHGYHGVPGGWAGFDICTTKVPQVFWDFGGTDLTGHHPDFPMSNRLNEFVQLTLSILANPVFARDLAERQFNYVYENRNIDRFIHVMEDLYITMSGRKTHGVQTAR